MAEPESFYGLQPRWLGPDRFYKVFVTPKLLSGARIAGQIYDAQAGRVVAQVGYDPTSALRMRAEREALYASVDPASAEFLGLDQHNFQLRASDITRITYRRRKSWWTAALPNVGVLTIDKRGESSRRLILVGDQDCSRIHRLLTGAGLLVLIKGEP